MVKNKFKKIAEKKAHRDVEVAKLMIYLNDLLTFKSLPD